MLKIDAMAIYLRHLPKVMKIKQGKNGHRDQPATTVNESPMNGTQENIRLLAPHFSK